MIFFYFKKLLKIYKFKDKRSKNLQPALVNFGQFFLKKVCPNHLGDIFRKNAPNAHKYRPNGEISAKLFTLDMCVTCGHVSVDESRFRLIFRFRKRPVNPLSALPGLEL
jgi:hypothetical protein